MHPFFIEYKPNERKYNLLKYNPVHKLNTHWRIKSYGKGFLKFLFGNKILRKVTSF